VLQAACEQHSGSSQSVKPSEWRIGLVFIPNEERALSLITLVVVFSIFAVLFEWKRAIDAVPAVIAATLEQTFEADATLSMARTTVEVD